MRPVDAMAFAFALVLTSCEKQVIKAPAPEPAHAKEAVASTKVALCEHGVPAELCPKCHPELVAAYKELDDWCDEHGTAESLCKQCNPSLDFSAKAAPEDWCNEHNVPESMCTKCKPALVAKFVEAGDFCREHGFPESVCPICHPELVKKRGKGAVEATKVRLASPETSQQAGITTVRVMKRRLAPSVDVVGQLEFDQNRLAQLTSRGEALVAEVKVDIGDEVRAGQPLLVLISGAIGADQAQLTSAKAHLATAKAAHEREQRLADKGVSPRRDAESAEKELAAAQAEYDAASSALGAAGAGSSGSGGRYVLSAPFAGVVVARDAVVGRSASAGQLLIEIADLSTMWAVLEIPEARAREVKRGQTVALSFEGSNEVWTVKIARVASSVDPATRTVQARVELPNPERDLKAGTFLRAQVELAAPRETLVVPKASIQRMDGKTVVFIKTGAGQYEPASVDVGVTTLEAAEILAGLEPGTEVVTTGAFLLKTEVLKDSIGAGCCADEGAE